MAGDYAAPLLCRVVPDARAIIPLATDALCLRPLEPVEGLASKIPLLDLLGLVLAVDKAVPPPHCLLLRYSRNPGSPHAGRAYT